MNAIYARQSIDRADSISIETQINHCARMIQGEYQVYQDKGYSGSNINRPDFERLMNDIKNGVVKSVYCYRLDRISRNILDFANLQEFFKKHDCAFISSSENLDTSSPMGRAMINIIMVFAQLERETIAGRIKDSYFARAKLGAYLGGGLPFGYRNVKADFNGKSMSVLEPDDNAEIVKNIFKDYNKRITLLSIAMALNKEGITTSTDKPFTAVAVRRILKNPVYAECSPDLYDYYFSKGYNIYNSIDDFTGEYGGLIVGKESGKLNRTHNPIEEQTFIIGAHAPLVDADTFITAQQMLLHNKARKRAGTGSYTWLTGLTKCGICGYSITSRVRKKHVYLTCRGHSNLGNSVCNNFKNYPVADLEKAIEKELIEYAGTLDLTVAEPDINHGQGVIKINQSIDNLMAALELAEGTAAAQRIIERINRLESEKRIIATPKHNPKQIINAAENIKETWEQADIKEKNRIASLFIDSIVIGKDKTEIKWSV